MSSLFILLAISSSQLTSCSIHMKIQGFKDLKIDVTTYCTNILDILLIFPPQLNFHILPINTITYKAYKMLDKRTMEAALTKMNAALVLNASTIAKKYSLECTMLKK
jgi:hypothetical protein